MGGSPLVGRTGELATLVDTVAGEGPRYAVLTAGPGLGKTSVMTALLVKAEALPLSVLRASPSEPEESLGFSALADLLVDFEEERYDELPVPQRTAIRAALLLEQASGEIDPRAVAVAFRTLLRTLAESQPVAVVIDDAHWLDSATVQALGHALRRSTGLPIRVVAATRPTGRSVDDWLPRRPEERTDLTLGAMRPDELAAVVRQTVGRTMDRATLRGVAEAAEGNPLFAIEVARQRGQVVATRGSFDELLSQRLGDLPRPTRLTLLTAALAGSPTVEVVAAARSATPEAVVDELDPAVGTGLVSVVDRIRFAHPLYASALVSASSEADVRAVHASLVDIDPGDEVRARHRGLAAVAVDEKLAEDLEIVARSARDRGAWDSAVDLMRLAVERSSAEAALAQRAITLGTWLARAGRPDEAKRWLRVAHCAGPPASLSAALELLRLTLLSGTSDEVDSLVRELTGPEVPPVVRAEAMVLDLDRHSGVTRAERAERLRLITAELTELGDEPEVLRVLARSLLMETECIPTADPAWRWKVDRARDIERVVTPALVLDHADMALADAAVIADRHAEARGRLRDLIGTSDEVGDGLSLPGLLGQLAWLEFRAGNWDVADDLLRESAEAASSQHAHWEQQAAVGLAENRGMRGDTEGALTDLDRHYVDARHPLSTYPIASWWASRAHVLLAAGRVEEACEAFARVSVEAAGTVAEVPGVLQADAPFLDCLITLGRLDEAAAHLRVVVDKTRRWDNPSVLVECGRIEVLLMAARGDMSGAVERIPDMLAAHQDGVGPLQRGHAYLTAGRVYRRGKAKTLAYDALERAAEVYDELGARTYAEQARAEQARVGLRPRASEDLTDTERQVAELALEGLRNREIADRMFLSIKTVEAVLGRTYRKLGIRSRAELARAIAEATAGS